MPRFPVNCLIIFIIFVAFFFFATPVSAANRFWVGTTNGANTNSTANWSTAQGACGVGGGASVPSSSDVAMFTSSCTNGATVNTSFTPLGINIGTGYSGTITQSTGIAITIGNTGYTQAAGAFVGSNATISDSGSFSVSAGSFTSTSGTLSIGAGFSITSTGTFTHSSGTVVFDGSGAATLACNSQTFNTVSISKNSGSNAFNVGSTCSLPLAGTNPSSTGTISNSGTITITGNWTLTGSYTANSGSVLTMSGSTLSISVDLNLTAGTFPSGITILTLGAALTNAGNLLPNGIALTLNTSGLSNLSCGTVTWGSVTISKSGSGGVTVGSNCTLPIAGTNPTSTSNLITNNGTINVTGSWTLNGSYTSNSGATLALTGTSLTVSVSIILSGGTFPQNLTSLTLGANLTNTANLLPNGIALTLNTSGTNNLSCGTVTWGSVTFSKSGSGSVVVGSNCTLPLAGTNPTSTSNIITNNGTINVTGNWTLNGTYITNSGAVLSLTGTSLTITGSLTLNGGTFPAGITSLSVGGDLNNSTNILPNNIALTMAGGINFVNCGTATFSSITIANTTSNDDTRFDSNCTTGDFIFSSGDIISSLSAFIISISGNYSQTSATAIAAANLTFKFTDINSQSISQTNGTFPAAFVIDKSGGIAQLTSDVSSSSTCSLVTGTLFLNGKVLSCGSNLSVSSGTTLQIVGSDFVVPTLSAGSIVKIVGDGDSSADIYSLPNWSFSNLIVSMIDSADSVIPTNITLTTNLVGHWKMDEGSGSTVDDSSINNNVGNITNAVFSSTVPTTSFPNPNSLSFDGAGDYLNIGNNLSIAQNKSAVSVTAWIRLNNITGIKDVFGLSVGTGNANSRVNLEISGDEIVCNARAGDAELGQSKNTTATNLAINTWYHVGCTIDYANDIVRLYTNGSLQPSAGIIAFPSASTSPTASQTSAIGIDEDKVGNDFSGFIDEVRFYDRLLTNQELAIMAAGDNSSSVTSTTVGNTYTQTLGGFTAPATMNVAGDWIHTGGTFTHNSGTVVLNGTDQNISGDTTFFNLTKNVTVPRTLTFAANSTQTIAGTLSLNGTSGNLLSLRSSSSPTQWRIDPQGTRDLHFLDVKDSNNINATVITSSGNNITDSGNNTNWGFDTTAPTTPGQPSTTTPTTDTTPTWTWTVSTDSESGLANPAYTVQWSQDPNFLIGVSTSTSNTNSYTHIVGLADGTWFFRAKATDVIGNESPYSVNGSVLVDTTAPSIPGTPTTTSPTADNTPTWTWTVSTDSGSGLNATSYSVQWCADSSFSGCGANVSTSATNSFTHSVSLADGTWFFRVKAKDALDNESVYSANGSVVVDTTGPSTPGQPSTTSPTADNTPTWTWTVSTDSTGLATPAYTVQWSQDPNFLIGVNTSTSNTNSFTHSVALADGTWFFRAKATDIVLNESAYSPNGTVIIDTTGPATPGMPSTTTPTTDTTPTWTWTVSTDSSVGLANPAYTIDWSQDSNFLIGVFSATSNTNSYTHTVALADGMWFVRVKAKDILNNESAYSPNGFVVIDTTAPTTPGAPATSTPINDSTPTWDWVESTDSGVGLPSNNAYVFEWSQSNTFSSGVSTANINLSDCSGGICSYTHSIPLADGTWYARVKAIDALGNESAYSSNGTITLLSSATDTTPPTGSILLEESETGKEDYIRTTSVTANISATDDTDPNSNLEMMISSDENFTGASWENFASTKNITLSDGDGTKTIYIKFRDSTLNESQIYSDSIVYDITDPEKLSLVEPENKSITNDNTPNFKFKKAQDETSGVDHYEIKLNDDTVWGDIDAEDPGGDHIREDDKKKVKYDDKYITVTPKKDLDDDEYKWKVTAYDRAGNSESTDSWEFTIDTKAPSIELTQIGSVQKNVKTDSESGQVFVVSTRRPTFYGKADKGSKITITIDSQTCTTIADSNSNWQCTFNDNLPIGNFKLYILVEDEAGNIAKLPVINIIIGSGSLNTEITDTSVIKGNPLTPAVEPNPEAEPQTGKIPALAAKTYRVQVKVIDKDGKPIPFSKVIIYSTPREGITDENGIVHFSDIPEGEHTIVVASDGNVGEQKVNIEGDGIDEIHYVIMIIPANPFLNPWVISVLVILGITIIVLVLLLRRRRNRSQT